MHGDRSPAGPLLLFERLDACRALYAVASRGLSYNVVMSTCHACADCGNARRVQFSESVIGFSVEEFKRRTSKEFVPSRSVRLPHTVPWYYR